MRYQSLQTKLTVALALTALLGACVALRKESEKQDRGIRFGHAKHTGEEIGLTCDACHDASSGTPAMPNHDTCSLCHEIDLEKMDPEVCGMCHTNPDISVLPRTPLFSEEIKFDHAPHVTAAVDCTKCHTAPDKSVLPAGNRMNFCMDCHGTIKPELNACSTCHNELSKDAVPQFRGETRIAHDAPGVWQKIHGQESRIDEAFCAICHDTQTFCSDCHSKTPPDTHTIAWRRHTHGLQAAWDRTQCSVCHEEDSCLKCHQNTKPASHRGSFARGRNTHCSSCHFPEQETSCTVCHESIDHKGAHPSPHVAGIFPANCSRCHPGGRPDRAPHFINSTIACAECHNR